MPESSRRAFTIRELLVVALCAIVIVSVFSLITIPSSRARINTKQAKDATMLRGIHQSWIVFSRENNGLLPTPGLMNRLPFQGVITPGRGEEDITQNTTANLYSMCIMANYFSPDLCVGPTEPSAKVAAFDTSTYDYKSYDATQRKLWDPNFKADLHVLSHVSYAHMPIAGELQSKHWRDTMDSNTAIVGNRGPLGGVHDPNSITNKIHRPYDKWSGNIVFSDNHVIVAHGFPTRPRPNGVGFQIAPECLPPGKPPPPTDAAITFTKEMVPLRGPVVQHD
jgi:hypothetical protein